MFTPRRIAAVAACFCVAAAVIFGFFLNGTGGGDKNPNVSHGVAQTVSFDNTIFYVCGEGEAEVLKNCGLPAVLTKELAGAHVSYLRLEESTSQYILTDKDEGESCELFEYAPKPNKNVYIISYHGKYFAAIAHDENGYKPLPSD